MTFKSRQRTTKTEASAENGMVTAMHPLAVEPYRVGIALGF